MQQLIEKWRNEAGAAHETDIEAASKGLHVTAASEASAAYQLLKCASELDAALTALPARLERVSPHGETSVGYTDVDDFPNTGRGHGCNVCTSRDAALEAVEQDMLAALDSKIMYQQIHYMTLARWIDTLQTLQTLQAIRQGRTK